MPKIVINCTNCKVVYFYKIKAIHLKKESCANVISFMQSGDARFVEISAFSKSAR